MRAAGNEPEGVRLRGVIVVLWRAGLRISEALALTESDLDPARGAVLVRRGKGGKRREVGMDRWGFERLEPWLQIHSRLPVGALFCVLRAPTRGRPCSPAALRATSATRPPRNRAKVNPVPRRPTTQSLIEPPYHPHIQHAHLGTPPSTYAAPTTPRSSRTVHQRPAPTIPATSILKPAP